VNIGVLLLLATVFGVITAWMAGNRRRNALAYGVAGFCFFLPTVIVLAVIGTRRDSINVLQVRER
jgi:hypothetical protein